MDRKTIINTSDARRTWETNDSHHIRTWSGPHFLFAVIPPGPLWKNWRPLACDRFITEKYFYSPHSFPYFDLFLVAHNNINTDHHILIFFFLSYFKWVKCRAVRRAFIHSAPPCPALTPSLTHTHINNFPSVIVTLAKSNNAFDLRIQSRDVRSNHKWLLETHVETQSRAGSDLMELSSGGST